MNIKKFENFKSKPYIEVDDSVIRDAYIRNSEILEERDIHLIFSKLDLKPNTLIHYYILESKYKNYCTEFTSKEFIYNRLKGRNILKIIIGSGMFSIFKDDDNYYWVKITNGTNYKCDDKWGLLKFLEDYGYIKKNNKINESAYTERTSKDMDNASDNHSYLKKEEALFLVKNINASQYVIILKEKGIKKSSSHRFYSQEKDILIKLIQNTKKPIIWLNIGNNTNIFKDDDEWFWVSIYEQTPPYRKYYRCDEWLGLIQLLKEKNVLN